MRRADRLFQIIQLLRAARAPLTASKIAEHLRVSQRTVYRDIEELLNRHTPIQGVAGSGYTLNSSYNLPPLMLNYAEVQAAVLGAHWVSQRGDSALADGARNLLSKISSVVPPELQEVVLEPSVLAPAWQAARFSDQVDLEEVRVAIHQRCKLRITYMDLQDRRSQRQIWPIAVAYFERARLLAAWCELRQAYRNFRTDRIERIEFSQEHFQQSIDELRQGWLAACKAEEQNTR